MILPRPLPPKPPPLDKQTRSASSINSKKNSLRSKTVRPRNNRRGRYSYKQNTAILRRLQTAYPSCSSKNKICSCGLGKRSKEKKRHGGGGLTCE
jgi:hypothetical protein